MTHQQRVTPQQGDILLRQTVDGGEVCVEAGIMEMSNGLGTAVYLSLFGGNEDDDGVTTTVKTWWGNYGAATPEEKYVSRTQNLLQALPAVTANFVRINDAVARDLQWLLDVNAVSSIAVITSMPALNTILIIVTIEARGEESTFNFTENWKASI